MRARNTRFLLTRSLVGWNGKFAIAVRPFDAASVVCQEKPAEPPFEDGCGMMVQTMPAGIDEEDTFGSAGAPGVTETVPFVHFTDRKIPSSSKCCQD